MNNELINREALIKRIDAEIKHSEWHDVDKLSNLLHDCRAEIRRLTTELKESRALSLKLAKDRETQDAENESLRNQNTALDAKLAEYSERKYVPMTDDDFKRIDVSTGMHDPKEAWAYERNIEAEVIRRAGLEVEK